MRTARPGTPVAAQHRAAHRARTAVIVGAALVALVAVASCGGASESSDSASEQPSPTEAPGTQTTVPVNAAEPPWSGPSVIIDTDLSLWWDDATAVGIANVLQQRDELRVLGMVTDVPNPVAVAALDAINTAYGHPDIPLGAMAGTEADTFDHGYTDSLVSRLPHSVNHSDDVPEAVALYRQLLAGEPDGSVTIVAIGGYTNLARLLDSPADDVSNQSGRSLLASKVKRVVINDGLFPDGGPALTNQKIDLDAANTVVTGDWPTPIAWVDGFTGIKMQVGHPLCTEAPAEHPMRIVYEGLFACAPPGDGNWDAPTLLYATDHAPDAFEELGQGGAAVVNESGGLSWQMSSEPSDEVYVHVTTDDALRQRIEDLLLTQ